MDDGQYCFQYKAFGYYGVSPSYKKKLVSYLFLQPIFLNRDFMNLVANLKRTKWL